MRETCKDCAPTTKSVPGPIDHHIGALRMPYRQHQELKTSSSHNPPRVATRRVITPIGEATSSPSTAVMRSASRMLPGGTLAPAAGYELGNFVSNHYQELAPYRVQASSLPPLIWRVNQMPSPLNSDSLSTCACCPKSLDLVDVKEVNTDDEIGHSFGLSATASGIGTGELASPCELEVEEWSDTKLKGSGAKHHVFRLPSAMVSGMSANGAKSLIAKLGCGGVATQVPFDRPVIDINDARRAAARNLDGYGIRQGVGAATVSRNLITRIALLPGSADCVPVEVWLFQFIIITFVKPTLRLVGKSARLLSGQDGVWIPPEIVRFPKPPR